MKNTLNTRKSLFHSWARAGRKHNRNRTNKVTCRYKSVIMNGFSA